MNIIPPPQAPEIEKDVLSVLCNRPELIQTVEETLNSDCFYTGEYQFIFDILMEIHLSGAVVSQSALLHRIIPSGRKDILPLYQEIKKYFTSEKSLIRNAEILSEYSTKRALLTKSLQILSMIEGNDPIDEIEREVSEATGIVISRNRNTEAISMSEAMDGLFELMNREPVNGITGIPTGVPLLDRVTGGWEYDDKVIIAARPGMGKCLGKGTKVIMFDGSLKNVEDIKVGEQIMGPDSTPRNILSTVSGTENMYWIRQNKAIDYRVNESHILSLKRSRNEGGHTKGDVINIPVSDYLAKNSKFKSNYKGYKSEIDFPEKNLAIEPYFLGLWIGDGTSRDSGITKPDSEIYKYLNGYSRRLNLYLDDTSTIERCPTWTITTRSDPSKKGTALSTKLRACGVLNNKHIPDEYLINSKSNRLELLAGLLDSDGYMDESACGFEITQKSESIAKQIKFLADSLGFGTSFRSKRASIKSTGYEGIAYRVRIWGDINKIPTKIKRKKARERQAINDWQVTGIKVEPDGVGEYFGFEIDGDRLFLLEDCTVTHNTVTATFHSYHSASIGIPTAFFSLEVRPPKLVGRMMANASGFSSSDITKGKLADNQKEIVTMKGNLSKSVPLYFYDNTKSRDINDIIRTIRTWRRKYGIEVFYLDYIGLCRDRTIKDQSNKTAVTESVQGKLSECIDQLGIPGIIFSQLNREAEGKTDKRPSLQNLKSSGKLEEDATRVIFLYRQDYYDYNDAQTKGENFIPSNDIEYIFAKNREGELGPVLLKCDVTLNRVYEQPTVEQIQEQAHAYSRNNVLNNIKDVF